MDAILLAVLSAAMWGSADFMGGLSSRSNVPVVVTWLSQLVGLVTIVVAALLVAAERVTASDLGWGAAAGLAGAVGLLLLYSGLARGPMSVVAPVTSVVGAVVPAVAGLLAGERPPPVGVVGIVVALPAIVLVASATGEPELVAGRRPRTEPVVIAQALGSGLMFGLFFVFVDRSGSGAGMWPLVGARCASVALLTVTVLAYRLHSGRRGEAVGLGLAAGGWPLVAGAGALDVAANAVFLLASRRGQLSEVAVVAAMYPAATVVLARFALREQFSRPQALGLGLAALAVGLVAYGGSL